MDSLRGRVDLRSPIFASACTRSDASIVYSDMTNCRILYFQGGVLEATDSGAPDDLVGAAKLASAKHPHLTAEIWRDGRKVAVVRPSWGLDRVIERPKKRPGDGCPRRAGS